MDIKNCLLNTNLFFDCKFLDLYCNLIQANQNKKAIKYITNKHHIIPKYYYKNNNLPIDNSRSNLVNLQYKDHLLAHYYLAKSSKDKVDIAHNLLSFRFLLNGLQLDLDLDEQLLADAQKLYEDSKKAIAQSSIETDRQISITLLGRSSPNKGKYKNKVKKERVRKTPIKNKKLSEFAKTRTGKKNSFYGKQHTAEAKALVSEKNSKAIIMLDFNTKEELRVFKSGVAAAEYLRDTFNITSTSVPTRISAVCKANDLSQKAYGFSWQFYNQKV